MTTKMLFHSLMISVISICLYFPNFATASNDSSESTANIPRNEYPRPQFVRRDWLCLNGQWEFEIDSGNSGLERGLLDRPLSGKIIVPFCPESKLSGIGNTDFMNAVWYRRIVDIPKQWEDRKVLLHFQAVDYETTVWVNGTEVARHTGGWGGFECDLEGIAEPGGQATIVVRARDLKDNMQKQPGGKQCAQYANYGCLYTRTTGIWQTVWMEPVHKIHINRPRITPDIAGSVLHITVPITNLRAGTRLRVTLNDGQRVITQSEIPADKDFSPMVSLAIPADTLRLWELNDPFLYDLKFELFDGNGKAIDTVTSYAGMRSITIDGMAFKLNGKPVFLRQVLDQGYYPDGILTAPSDSALKRDIELSQTAGFNGARLHQKVFEERFLYYCDKLGYLVWGEFGDWGIDKNSPQPTYITQWLEVLNRDYSHPSIMGWCPLNETYQKIEDIRSELSELTLGLFLATKAMDSTRIVLDASGYSHRVAESDVYDSHNYQQDPNKFAADFNNLDKGKPYTNPADKPYKCSVSYRGQPYFCSEFGGIKWNPDMANVNVQNVSWGYGDAPKTVEEFFQRFEGLCNALLDNPKMFGYCYTQLTDVFQEQNGIYKFDRSLKLDIDRINKIQTRPAAIEKKQSSLSAQVTVTQKKFGKMPDGKQVDIYTLANSAGMQVGITSFGAAVLNIIVPDRKGIFADITPGYDTFDGYLKNNPYFGGIVGRFGNRIAKGKFTLDGVEYSLAINNDENHLHGGKVGFDRILWTAESFEKDSVAGVKLNYFSKDGEEGYPGNLNITVIYTLTNDNELKIDYAAVTDKATPVNLTQHGYWNLAGTGNGDILGHQLMINADNFTPVDSTLIPTGKLSSVKNTPMDFTKPTAIGERINQKYEQLEYGKGYDHNWVLNKKDNSMTLACSVYEPVSGRFMEIYTTEPGLQFYSGNFLDGSIAGKNGKVYNFRNAIVLETQHFPDSPNQLNFPSTILKPGKKYESHTAYRFSAK